MTPPKLSKRKKEVLDAYSTDVPRIIFGDDYRIVIELALLGLLDYDHVSGKVGRPKGTPKRSFSYRLHVWHPDLPMHFETITIDDPRKEDRVARERLKVIAEERNLPFSSFILEMHAIHDPD